MQIRSLCISMLMDRTRWYEILNSEYHLIPGKKKSNEIINTWPCPSNPGSWLASYECYWTKLSSQLLTSGWLGYSIVILKCFKTYKIRQQNHHVKIPTLKASRCSIIWNIFPNYLFLIPIHITVDIRFSRKPITWTTETKFDKSQQVGPQLLKIGILTQVHPE